jgi:hypothetical protein
MFAEVEVSDTGSGIPPQDQVRIFEPFERGHQPNRTAVPGTGLGPAITKMLVQIMGGKISLTSKPGGGSTFEVRLMFSEVTYPSAPQKSHADIRGYKGRRRTIVVADDDRTHCAIVAEVARFRGHCCRLRQCLPGNGAGAQAGTCFCSTSRCPE